MFYHDNNSHYHIGVTRKKTSLLGVRKGSGSFFPPSSGEIPKLHHVYDHSAHGDRVGQGLRKGEVGWWCNVTSYSRVELVQKTC